MKHMTPEIKRLSHVCDVVYFVITRQRATSLRVRSPVTHAYRKPHQRFPLHTHRPSVPHISLTWALAISHASAVGHLSGSNGTNSGLLLLAFVQREKMRGSIRHELELWFVQEWHIVISKGTDVDPVLLRR